MTVMFDCRLLFPVIDVRGMITNSVKTNEVVSHFRKYKSMFSANLSFIIRKILNKLNYATTKYLMVSSKVPFKKEHTSLRFRKIPQIP